MVLSLSCSHVCVTCVVLLTCQISCLSCPVLCSHGKSIINELKPIWVVGINAMLQLCTAIVYHLPSITLSNIPHTRLFAVTITSLHEENCSRLIPTEFEETYLRLFCRHKSQVGAVSALFTEVRYLHYVALALASVCCGGVHRYRDYY